jgi:hypothetical protein
MISILCECFGLTRSNDATIRERKVCLVSRECVEVTRSNACNNQREGGMICTSCECVEVTRSIAAKIRGREECLVSRVSVLK